MTDLDRLLLLEKDRALNQNVGKVYEEEYESLKAKIEGDLEYMKKHNQESLEPSLHLGEEIVKGITIENKDLESQVAKLKEENKELKFHLEKWQTGVWTILAKHEDKK